MGSWVKFWRLLQQEDFQVHEPEETRELKAKTVFWTHRPLIYYVSRWRFCRPLATWRPWTSRRGSAVSRTRCPSTQNFSRGMFNCFTSAYFFLNSLSMVKNAEATSFNEETQTAVNKQCGATSKRQHSIYLHLDLSTFFQECSVSIM